MSLAMTLPLVSPPTDFAVYETFPFHSVSVESYEFNGDQFVAFAQPDSGFCTLYIWDHVEMVFRRFHNITCKLLRMKAYECVQRCVKERVLMFFDFRVSLLKLVPPCTANPW